MADAVSDLKAWFSKLSDTDKKAVVGFLYEGKAILREGQYVGPKPELVTRGLFVGPVPASSTNVCRACGRPL